MIETLKQRAVLLSMVPLLTIVHIFLTPQVAHAAGTGWSSGVSYYSNVGPMGSWRGSPATIYGCWADAEDSAPVQSSATDCMGQASASGYAGDIDIAVGFLVTGESMQSAASGAYESRWRAMAQSIRANWGKHRTVYIRPAHEMNGDWYGWKVTSANASSFKQAWIRYYNIVQQELVQKGYDAKMTIGYNWGSSGVDINSMWPGDQYVDVVGVDMYDVWWGTNPPTCIDTASRWNSQLTWNNPSGNYGLNAWVAFAKNHGKPLAISEWGLSDKTSCDNPYWISQMNNWFAANAGTGPGQLLYEIYFNVSGYGACKIYPESAAESPNGAKTYKSLPWGNGGGGSTSPPTTPPPTGGGGSTVVSYEVSQVGNLLSGRPFSSSQPDSTSEAGNSVGNITDGNGGTRWISQPASPVAVTSDLGGFYTLSKVSIKWAGDTIKNFNLQISKDGINWTTFYSGVTNNSSPQYVDYTTFSTIPTGKYLRINGVDRWNTAYGNSIWEAGAYGTVASVDLSSPSVIITSPAHGSVAKGTVAIASSASDNIGVVKKELLVNGSIVASTTSPSASMSWDTTKRPDSSYTIGINAYDAAGNVGKSQNITLRVVNTTPIPAPVINTFGANPASVVVGDSATLTWQQQYATGCSVAPGGPTNTTASSWQTLGFLSAGVKTYTLSCSNSSGSASKTTAVTVSAPVKPPSKPIFVASVPYVAPGGNVTLSWDSVGATSCILNPGNISTSANAGKLVKSISQTTKFTLSCSNSAGSVSADPVTVTVTTQKQPAPDPVVSTVIAKPDNLAEGQTAKISWVASGVAADSCSVSPSPLVATGATGTWTTPPLYSSTKYTVKCVNAEGKSAAQSVTVAVGTTAVVEVPVQDPVMNISNTIASTVQTVEGKKVTNAAATDRVSGLTTLDPSNITNTAKEQRIVKIEYYIAGKLVQSVKSAPFALDTTKLDNAEYTITERTYFDDGSANEVEKVVTIANDTKRDVTAKKDTINLPLIVGGIVTTGVVLAGGIGFGLVLMRRRRRSESTTLPPAQLNADVPFATPQPSSEVPFQPAGTVSYQDQSSGEPLSQPTGHPPFTQNSDPGGATPDQHR